MIIPHNTKANPLKKTIENITTISVWGTFLCCLAYIIFAYSNDNIENISTISINLFAVGVGSYAIINTSIVVVLCLLKINNDNALKMLFIGNKKFIIVGLFLALIAEVIILNSIFK